MLTIPFIENFSSEEIPSAAVTVDVQSNNWAKEYPYAPKVQATLWHDGKNLYIRYKVNEEDIRAIVKEDNGPVYTDSCAEFFIALDDNGYYNLEANCTGNILLSHRKGRNIEVQYADDSILKGIKRNPSLGHGAFDVTKAHGPWELQLAVPAKSFFKNNIQSLNGLKAKCNIYKCGDKLPRPHFLSWQPIHTSTPDFHRPEFFGEIEFEK